MRICICNRRDWKICDRIRGSVIRISSSSSPWVHFHPYLHLRVPINGALHRLVVLLLFQRLYYVFVRSSRPSACAGWLGEVSSNSIPWKGSSSHRELNNPIFIPPFTPFTPATVVIRFVRCTYHMYVCICTYAQSHKFSHKSNIV